MADPCRDGLPSLFGDLELNRTCLLLRDDRPRCYTVAAGDVLYPQLHQVAGAELAVDRQIEQSEFPHALCQLKTYPDRQISFRRTGAFCPTSLPLFQGSQ